MTLAIIRFVNTTLDRNQTSDRSIKLTDLAEQMGLPPAFVEIRHWGTHDATLPGSEVLRDMGIRALKWLWENYWDKSEEKADPISLWKNGTIDMAEIISLAQENQGEIYKRLVIELTSDENFIMSKSVWEPLMNRLFMDQVLAQAFIHYVVDTLISIPKCFFNSITLHLR
jgi:Las1-like